MFCVRTAATSPRPLELGERHVARVRVRLGQCAEVLSVEPPRLDRVAAEGFDRRVFDRVVLRPDTVR